jgi:hypothetical protein
MYEADSGGEESGAGRSGPDSGPGCVEARELEARMAELAGTINVATAGLVDAIGRVIELGAWAGYGYRSPEHWVSLHAGVSAAHARALVLMARRRADFPQVMTAFGEGRLSEDQIRPIVRHVPAGYDESCARVAQHLAVPQLERVMRTYAFGEPPPTAQDLADGDDQGNEQASDQTKPDDEDEHRAERDREQRQFLSFGYDEAGLWRQRAALSPELGEVVATALRVFREDIFHEGGGRASWHQALVRMAEVAMAAHGDAKDRRGHDRYQVLLHLRNDQVDTLEDTQATPPPAYFHLGPLVSQKLARYMACDAAVRLIINHDGRAVSVGHKHRTVPDHTRLAVTHRDGGGCRIPGCIATWGTQVHHITHWQDGGPTDTWNLMSPCGPHHRAIHRGDIIVTGNADKPDGLHITDRWGKPLTGPPPKPPPRAPPTGNWRHPTGEKLDHNNLYLHKHKPEV